MGDGQYWPQAPEATEDLKIGKEELTTGGRGSLAGSILTRLPTFALEHSTGGSGDWAHGGRWTAEAEMSNTSM